MPDRYRYDVFFSYVSSGGGPPGDTAHEREWSRHNFLPVLRAELGQVRDRKLEVFSDRDLPFGNWPNALRDALLSSRVLVAIVSPTYFREPSTWCRWEFGSMLERGAGLVVPVV